MYNDLRKSFLELTVIWKDDDMFELRVRTSNSRFSGTTEVYATSDTLSDFAKKLLGFPTDNKTLFFEAGQKDSYSYFSMRFYCIDTAGHIGVEINLEENVSTVYRQEEKDKLKLEIIVVPSAIDNFQKELLNLTINEDGIATLYGQHSNPDNT
jgi:hypothetical protein